MTSSYCGRHSIHYPGRTCPRCDAEERHREHLDATERSAAETVEAMRDSDYRHANPGEYECPHCKYISLRSKASRCPLCHGEIGNQYWVDVRAGEEAERDRRRVMAEEAAAEEKRTAPARAAQERKRKMAEEDRAAVKRRKDIVQTSSYSALAVGMIGFIVGGMIGCFGALDDANNGRTSMMHPFAVFLSVGVKTAITLAVIVGIVGFFAWSSVAGPSPTHRNRH